MDHEKPKYSSGELILQGDKITFNDEKGFVEFVVTSEHSQWETYWKNLGSGIMLSVPSFGSVFISMDDDELSFVSRKQENG